METKKVNSIANRIKKANSSYSCMGDMMLCLEIDSLTISERRELKAALLARKNPVSYGYLDQKCEE